MNRLFVILSVIVVGVLVSCKPGTPKQFIQPDEMEDLLVDIHIARAMAMENPSDRELQRELLLDAVFRKHGVSREHFDSSLVYYYTRADRFDDIYSRVSSRLEDYALALGATEGEIGKFSSLNATGDTANIWSSSSMLVMLPVPPYNRVDFVLEADSSYQMGDTFLMQFMADFVYQSGTKDCQIYVAVEMSDTTVIRQMRCTYSGLNQLRIESLPKKDIKQIRGFLYLAVNTESSSSQRLLFVNNIQFIRFHHHETSQVVQTDSVQSVIDTPQPLIAPISSRDTSGSGRKILSSERRAPANRMVQRIDSIKARR